MAKVEAQVRLLPGNENNDATNQASLTVVRLVSQEIRAGNARLRPD